MQKGQHSPEVQIYNYFAFSLDSCNQFKAQIHGQRAHKKGRNESYLGAQKLASNQIYNSFPKQILLQKSCSPPFTPKKEYSEEISQYISDRNQPKPPILEPDYKILEPLEPLPKQSVEDLIVGPMNELKFEEDSVQKINLSHKLQLNNLNDDDQKSQLLELQNNQDDKAPKRGLTYISKKLSLILRQKKRIKSSELFNISLFDDALKPSHSEKPPVQNLQNDMHIKQQKLQKMEAKESIDTAQSKQSKQRRNVRRRIYDSINVMVALGIIKKVKNEFIYVEQKDHFSDHYFTIQQEQILGKKRDYLLKLQNDCQYKQQCLNYLTEAYAKLKILRKINAEYEDKLNSLSDNTSTQASSTYPEQKIQFPFVLAQNGNKKVTIWVKKIKVELINENQSIEPRVKRANDWTDFIQIQNKSREKQIDKIKIQGQNLKVISDVDCVNHLTSLEIQEHAQTFQKHQKDILRDYQIISQHKQKRNEEQARSAVKI